MNHDEEETVREQIAAHYEAFSAALARRDADTMMRMFLPGYTVTTPDKQVLDYARVEKEVRLEAGAEWLLPRALLFEVQDVQISAPGTEALVAVQVTREGKGAHIILRRDTWNQTPRGWRLRESVAE